MNCVVMLKVHYKTQNVALGYSVHGSDRADQNLFAGILQAKIRQDDHISAALDWLFARQSCDRHCNLQV